MVYNQLRISAYITLIVAVCSGSAAQAVSLDQAIELAFQNDPEYLSVQMDVAVSQEQAEQADARLRPGITLSAAKNRNQRDYSFQNNGISFNERYPSDSLQLELKQALWKHADYIASDQAEQQVVQAGYQLLEASQQLLLRTTETWFDVLKQRDQLTVRQAQVKLLRHQMKQIQREQQLGVSSDRIRTEMEAKLQNAEAERMVAQSQLAVSKATLQSITGPLSEASYPTLPEDFAPEISEELTLEEWLQQAEENNSAIKAARVAFMVARQEVDKQQAGHEPVVDLVVSYGKNSQGAGINGGQNGFDSKVRTIGVQMNAPLYSGGGQQASVRQALHQQQKAEYQLQRTIRQVRLQMQQSWHRWQAAQAVKTAAGQALKHSARLLQQTEMAKYQGDKVKLDVLQARQKKVEALQQLHSSNYEILLSYYQLLAAAGQLELIQLQQLSQHFINYAQAIPFAASFAMQ